MAVNKERVKLAVEALESGQFEQGTGALRTSTNEFCCLGVFCEVAMANGLPLTRELNLDGEYRYRYSEEDCSGVVLPDVVQDWYGFDDTDPYIDPLDSGKDTMTGAIANDGYHWSFPKIAEAFRLRYLPDGEPWGEGEVQ